MDQNKNQEQPKPDQPGHQGQQHQQQGQGGQKNWNEQQPMPGHEKTRGTGSEPTRNRSDESPEIGNRPDDELGEQDELDRETDESDR